MPNLEPECKYLIAEKQTIPSGAAAADAAAPPLSGFDAEQHLGFRFSGLGQTRGGGTVVCGKAFEIRIRAFCGFFPPSLVSFLLPCPMSIYLIAAPGFYSSVRAGVSCDICRAGPSPASASRFLHDFPFNGARCSRFCRRFSAPFPPPVETFSIHGGSQCAVSCGNPWAEFAAGCS